MNLLEAQQSALISVLVPELFRACKKRVGNFHLDSDKILPFRYLLPALVQRKQLLHLSGIQPPFQYPRMKMKLHGLGCEWLQEPFQPHWEALPALKAVGRAQTISCRCYLNTFWHLSDLPWFFNVSVHTCGCEGEQQLNWGNKWRAVLIFGSKTVQISH